MFHISASCDHQQDPWSYNFMRVMSRVFRLHQNFAHVISSICDPCITTLHHFVSHHIDVVTQASCNLLRRHKTLHAYRSLIVLISLSHSNRNFVSWTSCSSCHSNRWIWNLIMDSELSWGVHIKITRVVIWISLDTEYPRCAASPCVALQHVQTYTR